MTYALTNYLKAALLIPALLVCCSAARADESAPAGFSRAPEWSAGVELAPAFVPHTNPYLKGENPSGKAVDAQFSADLRAAFRFNPATREGVLYRGAYQCIGLGFNGFSTGKLLGSPVSAYVFQGAPIVTFSPRMWLGYEWQFGAAFGWKHYAAGDGEDDVYEYNAAVSTPVTAAMGIALKLHYELTPRWQLSVAATARHYSNGNTSIPNGGVNSLGASLGIAYVLNPARDAASGIDEAALTSEADRRGWIYDITLYGAWRKRIVAIGEPAERELCPGRFGVVGAIFSPLYKLNRYVAVGPAVQLRWDESAGITPYWVSGSYDDNMKFERPPFGKQLSAGLSAHAELTMPIFTLNAGLGYDILCPVGDKRFFQTLTLKTFVTRNVYINTGYRLGNFKDPQNLMLGLGVRL
ncbi:MAG: acyloxyacyl hydrolase [Muribaculaceae bacterium]|nr:acyloxyacyl hydrolase [Muribaculaceae bacterium]